ncbi:MAG: hypothetical protein ACFCD0_02770 [Gemmataceae bacterium]
MTHTKWCCCALAVPLFLATWAQAGVGDPQIRTNHPWYPGELACSTFERLFATQAEIYRRVVGVYTKTDQQKALAAWLWRNTHYWHAEQGGENYWGQGFKKGGDPRSREYWTGMFAYGFGICGTTHSQWIPEMEALFGPGRSRAIGVNGHVAFEVFLKGGPYKKGKWVLLDHDLSTVIFNEQGTALLSMEEIYKNWKQLAKRNKNAKHQQGWLVCGLSPKDGSSYSAYRTAEYLAGYGGPPPMVHLRRGETLKRYFRPGLADGKTFVFWGRNYNTRGIPGPERSHTWVNQPERMYKSRTGAGYKPGQARYTNAVYTYKPDFNTKDYKEGVIEESENHVIFEFYTPYIIAATPPNKDSWGIYDKGCRNGFILRGKVGCQVSVSVDQGASWQECGQFRDAMDLTDTVKGHRQYFIKFWTSAKNLRNSGLTMITVCQTNSSILPRLKDNRTKISFAASGQAVVSAGPNLPQAQTHIVPGKFNTPKVTLELTTPRREPIKQIYVAAHVRSGSPPNPATKYSIDYSTGDGKTWKPLIKDWRVIRRGQEPNDFWSQSFCWGSTKIKTKNQARVQVRFHNTGRRDYARCEAHLIYDVSQQDDTRVTYAWSDTKGKRQASYVFPSQRSSQAVATWTIPTGQEVRTHWVEFSPSVRK